MPGPGLTRAGRAALDHTFTTTWESLASQHNPNSLRVYHLASLVSGGFLIQAASNGVNTFGGPTDSNYDRLVVFDSAAVQRFGADGLNGWYTGRLDVCGLAGAGADRFICSFDLAPRSGGAGPGYLARYRVDWAGNDLVTEATLGGDFGTDCYYVNQVAPMAALPPHVVGGGFVVNDYGLDAYNAPPGFPTLGQLEISYG